MRLPPENVYYLYPEPGDVISDGFQTVLVRDDQQVVLDKVEQLGLTGDLDVLGVLYAGARRNLAFVQVMPGFPPARKKTLGRLKPVEGARVRPGGLGIELIIGYEINGSEFAARTGLRIHYHVGDTQYVADFPSGIAFCPGMADASCKQAYADWVEKHPVRNLP